MTDRLRIHTDIADGFDVVAECTGVESIVQDAINYVSRGGTLLVYGVYADEARVHWSPTKIFVDEIRVIGSFSQTYCFPRAIDLLDSGKIRTKGMVYVPLPPSPLCDFVYPILTRLVPTYSSLPITKRPSTRWPAEVLSRLPSGLRI